MSSPCQEVAVASQYKVALNNLTINSKVIIDALTKLAGDNVEYASIVIKVIENYIEVVPVETKLTVLYLIDSILKNVHGVFVQLFEKDMDEIFPKVFEQIQEPITRMRMWKLRNTWNSIFSTEKLNSLDFKCHQLDAGWPWPCKSTNKILSSSPPSKYVNAATTAVVNPVAKKPVVVDYNHQNEDILMYEEQLGEPIPKRARPAAPIVIDLEAEDEPSDVSEPSATLCQSGNRKWKKPSSIASKAPTEIIVQDPLQENSPTLEQEKVKKHLFPPHLISKKEPMQQNDAETESSDVFNESFAFSSSSSFSDIIQQQTPTPAEENNGKDERIKQLEEQLQSTIDKMETEIQMKVKEKLNQLNTDLSNQLTINIQLKRQLISNEEEVGKLKKKNKELSDKNSNLKETVKKQERELKLRDEKIAAGKTKIKALEKQKEKQKQQQLEKIKTSQSYYHKVFRDETLRHIPKKIFNYLSHQELLICSKVCKLWNGIITPLLTTKEARCKQENSLAWRNFESYIFNSNQLCNGVINFQYSLSSSSLLSSFSWIATCPVNNNNSNNNGHRVPPPPPLLSSSSSSASSAALSSSSSALLLQELTSYLNFKLSTVNSVIICPSNIKFSFSSGNFQSKVLQDFLTSQGQLIKRLRLDLSLHEAWKNFPEGSPFLQQLLLSQAKNVEELEVILPSGENSSGGDRRFLQKVKEVSGTGTGTENGSGNGKITIPKLYKLSLNLDSYPGNYNLLLISEMLQAAVNLHQFEDITNKLTKTSPTCPDYVKLFTEHGRLHTLQDLSGVSVNCNHVEAFGMFAKNSTCRLRTLEIDMREMSSLSVKERARLCNALNILLFRNSTSLEGLIIRGSINNSNGFQLQFPQLYSLRCIKLVIDKEELIFAPGFSLPTIFPNLFTVFLDLSMCRRPVLFDSCLQSCQQSVHNTVHTLVVKYSGSISQIAAQDYLRQFSQLFPRVKRLEIQQLYQQLSGVATTISGHFPFLQILHLNLMICPTYDCSTLDSIFTGFSKDICRQLRSQQQTDQVMKNVVNSLPSIVRLQYLCDVCVSFHGDFYKTPKSSFPFLLSHVSHAFAFSQALRPFTIRFCINKLNTDDKQSVEAALSYFGIISNVQHSIDDLNVFS